MAFNAGSIEATLTLNRNPFTDGLRAARAEARNFAKEKFETTIKAKLDDASLDAVKAKFENFARKVFTVKLRVDLDSSSVAAVTTRIRAIGKNTKVEIKAELSTASMAAISSRLAAFTSSAYIAKIEAKLDNTSLNYIRQQLKNVSATAKVEVDRALFDKLIRDLNAFNGKVYRAKATVDVDDTAFRDLVARLRLFGASSTNHNVNVNTSGAVNGVQLLLSLLPLILPVGASAVVSLTGLVGGLASAFGVAAIGVGAFALVATSVFKTINDAAKASTGASATAVAALAAVKTARTALSNAFQQAAEADAAANKRVLESIKGVEKASEAAARANAAAARTVQDAERALTSAQNSAKYAQETLNQARKDAVTQLENLKLSLRGAALSEEQAMLNLVDAQERYNKALKDGTSGNELKQLELNVRQASLAIDESKQRYKETKAASDEWAKTGIEGSKGVKDAQRGVASATDGVSDAQRNLKDAQAAQTQTAKDGIANVQEAEAKLKEARDQATLTHLKGQKDIAEARTKLAEAEKKYNTEAQGGAKALSAAMNRAKDALVSLKGEYESLVKRTEGPVANAFVANFKAAEAFLKTIDPLVTRTADAFTIIGNKVEKYFAGPLWKDFVGFLADNIVPNITRFADIIGYATLGAFNLIKAFDPLADFILDGMVKGMQDFAGWTEKLGKDEGFQTFLRIAKESLPKIVDFIGSVIQFLFKLSVALAPFGNVILDVLTMIFNGLSKLPPEWLAAIGEGLAVIFTALLLGASGPVALVAGVIGGIAAALAYLYTSNENVRKSVDDMVTSLRDKFAPIWKVISDNFRDKILPAWDKLVDVTRKNLLPVLEDLGKKFVDDILPALKDLAETITGKLVPKFLEFMIAIEPFTTWLTETLGKEAIDTFETLVRTIDGAFTIIGGILDTFTGIFTGDWEKFGEGLKGISDGFMTIIAGIFGMSLDEMDAEAKEFRRGSEANWVDLWGGIKTETDGSTTVVKGKWNEWLDSSAKNFEDQLKTPVSNGWVSFWGGIKTEQNGSQTVVAGSWNTFWSDSAKNFDTQLKIPVSEGWISFWGGVKTEQNGSQTVVGGSWNKFWTDSATNFKTQLVDPVSKGWTDFWTTTEKQAATFEATIRTAWDGFWNGVSAKAAEIWGVIQRGTETAVTNLGIAWRKLGNFFRDPINFVIDVVINRGVIDSWNTVMGWIGQPKLAATKLNPLPAFAEGGQIVGPGHGTSDSILARVSNGEYIMPAKRAKRHGHFLEALRQGQPEAVQAAGGGNNPSPYPRYAAGGPVETGLAFARAQQGKPYIWGGVGPAGYDCSGFMSAITNAMLGRGIHSRIGTTSTVPWPGWKSGLSSQFTMGNLFGSHMAGTLAGNNVESGSGHGPMVGGRALGSTSAMFKQQFSLPQIAGQFISGGLGGAAGGVGGSAYAPPVSFWESIGNKVTELFKGIGSTAGMPGGGAIGEGMKKIPPALMAKVLSAAQAKLTALIDPSTGGKGAGSLGTLGGPAPAGQVNAWIMEALGILKFPSSYAAGIYQQIMTESGGNPNAVQHGYTDVNTLSGNLARGIMQVIPPTFAANMLPGHGNIMNPVDNIIAGSRYALKRYGSGWFAPGPQHSHGYDTGGMMPRGPGDFTKGNVGPERVLSPKQTSDFERLVAILEQLVADGGALNGDGASVPAIGNLYVTTTPRATAQDIVEEATFAAKRARRQGVHSR